MSSTFPISDPMRIEEPHAAQEFSDVFTRVATEGKTMIVRRNGEDLAAVMPIEQLQAVRELVSRQQAEQRAAELQWNSSRPVLGPPQQWYDDDDNPFTPE